MWLGRWTADVDPELLQHAVELEERIKSEHAFKVVNDTVFKTLSEAMFLHIDGTSVAELTHAVQHAVIQLEEEMQIPEEDRIGAEITITQDPNDASHLEVVLPKRTKYISLKVDV